MPRIGIFWYSPEKSELFGVRSQYVSSGTSLEKYSETHQKVWNQERQKCCDFDGNPYPGEENNPFCAKDYTKIPRGRVSIDDYGFVVYVGHWINNYNDYVKYLICKEFEIPENTTFEISEHWDLGKGWSE